MTPLPGVIAVLGPQAALLIERGAGPDVLRDVTEAVLAGGPVRRVLTVLSQRGLASLPDFALVVQDIVNTHLVVRGSFGATALPPGETPIEVSGQGVSTWLERLAEPDVPVQLRVGGYVVAVPPRDPTIPSCLPYGGDEVTALLSVALPTVAAQLETAHDVISQDTSLGWHTTPPDRPHPPPDVTPASEPDTQDPFRHMLGQTEFFGVEAAAVRVPTVPDTPSSPTPTSSGSPPGVVPAVSPGSSAPPHSGLIDAVPSLSRRASPPTTPHSKTDDGHTVSRAELLRLAAGTPAVEKGSSGPQVQAVHCPAGHANPPNAERCRICATAVTERAVTWVPRPILGRLTFEDGFVHAVHQPVLLGRDPSVDQTATLDEMQLLPLPDPEQMLSRTHAELRIVDWQVQVVDRGSKNGTVVTLPGREPQQLRAREPFMLIRGARVVLGGVTTFEFGEAQA